MTRRPLLTLRLVAEWTQQPYNTVRTWVNRKKIQPVACAVQSRALLFDAHDVPPDWFRDSEEAA